MAAVKTWHVLAVSHLAAGAAGWALSPRELLAENVEHTGLFSADTDRTLAAAVLSLRREDKLLVYTYRGAAHVVAERSELLGLVEGAQTVAVSATVSYLVDLGRLDVDDVHWDEAAGLVTVRLPPLVMGEVALHAEAARVSNEGVLTYSDWHVQDLLRLNYRTARRAFVKQAQEATLVAIAEARARESVERHFGIALAAAGRPDVRVVATFEGR